MLRSEYNYNSGLQNRNEIHAKIAELHIMGFAQKGIVEALSIGQGTVSKALSRYYQRAGLNPVTITLQSR